MGGIAGVGGAGRDAGPDASPDQGAVVDGPAADAAICVGLSQMTLGGIIWRDQVDGTTTWIERPPVAGRTSQLLITLTNLASTSFQYPGVDLKTLSAGVGGAFAYRLFSIAPGQSLSIDFNVTFSSTLASGARVQFRAEVFGDDVRRTRCSDSPALDFDVVLR